MALPGRGAARDPGSDPAARRPGREPASGAAGSVAVRRPSTPRPTNTATPSSGASTGSSSGAAQPLATTRAPPSTSPDSTSLPSSSGQQDDPKETAQVNRMMSNHFTTTQCADMASDAAPPSTFGWAGIRRGGPGQGCQRLTRLRTARTARPIRTGSVRRETSGRWGAASVAGCRAVRSGRRRGSGRTRLTRRQRQALARTACSGFIAGATRASSRGSMAALPVRRPVAGCRPPSGAAAARPVVGSRRAVVPPSRCRAVVPPPAGGHPPVLRPSAAAGRCAPPCRCGLAGRRPWSRCRGPSAAARPLLPWVRLVLLPCRRRRALPGRGPVAGCRSPSGARRLLRPYPDPHDRPAEGEEPAGVLPAGAGVPRASAR